MPSGAVLATAGWCAVLLVPGLPLPLLVGLLGFTGCASSAVMVGFAIAKESTPAALAGTAGGIANMGNMLGGMIMQPAVGWVLDQRWTGTFANGVRIYDFDAYRAGFSADARLARRGARSCSCSCAKPIAARRNRTHSGIFPRRAANDRCTV